MRCKTHTMRLQSLKVTQGIIYCRTPFVVQCGQKLSGLWTTLQPSLSSTAFLQRAPTLK